VEDRNLLVPCVMILKPLQASSLHIPARKCYELYQQQYQSITASGPMQAQDRLDKKAHSKKGRENTAEGPLEPTVQGAVLLQSLLRLNEPHNQLVLDRQARNFRLQYFR
jgi:nucleolar protein 9